MEFALVDWAKNGRKLAPFSFSEADDDDDDAPVVGGGVGDNEVGGGSGVGSGANAETGATRVESADSARQEDEDVKAVADGYSRC